MFQSINNKVVMHDHYFRIASNNLKKAVEKNTEVKGNGNSLKRAIEYGLKQDELLVATMFYYLTLESFINFYANFKDIRKHNKPTVSKWTDYPLENCGKSIDKNILERLKEFNTVRNNLVHYKVKEVGKNPFEEHTLSALKVKEYEQLVVDLVSELCDIDEEMASSHSIKKTEMA